MGMLFQFLTTILIFAGYFVVAKDDTDSSPTKPNPSKDDDEGTNSCKTYKIKIADDYKSYKGTKPASTEVAKEARENGLVPVQITTTFASPNAVGLNNKLPDSVQKVMIVIDENNKKNNYNSEDGQIYTFVTGAVVDSLDEDGGDNNDKKDEKEGGEKAKEPASAEKTNASSVKQQAKVPQKLLSRPQVRPLANNLRD